MPESLLPLQPPQVEERRIPLDQLTEELEGPVPENAFLLSVQRLGVQQPIVVVAQKGGYRVLDGRKRVFAAREAGLAEIPAVVHSASAWRAPELLTLVSELRKPNLIAQVRAVESLIAVGGDENTVQSASGLSRSRVKKLFSLVHLEERLKAGFYSDAIKAGAAAAAATLPEEVQVRLGDDFEREGILSPAHVRKVAEDLKVAELIGDEEVAEPGREDGGGAQAAGADMNAPEVRKAEAARIGRRMLELLADVALPDRVRRGVEEAVAALES
jgi:ParB/RepB/Spo0J family partition protein